MDGSQSSTVDLGLGLGPFYPSLVPLHDVGVEAEGLVQLRLDDLQTLLVTKTRAGFDLACVEALRQIVQNAAAGRYGPLKFLAFELAHEGFEEASGAEGFSTLVNEVANLILRSPIVSVACARAHLSGADMEFALACNMLIGEQGASFSFAADPAVSVGAYGFLSQKIGFVRAERLMETSEVLDVDQMQDLLLLKAAAEAGAGLDGIETFLKRTLRRHNSCYGIYRAQRIALPAVDMSLRS